MSRATACALLALALVLAPGLGVSQEEQKLGIPIYVPVSRGDTTARVGAATRGVGAGEIEALAPDHVAFTITAQPVLWWFQPEATSARVDFVLVDTEQPDPLVDVTLRHGVEKGVHPVRLAEHGVRLETGRAYQWLVALVPNPRSRSEDVVSGGLVQRVAAGPELSAALESAPASRRWRAYALYGVWYEALSGISEQIRKQPRDRSLRNQRAQLLRDGKLIGAAAWDRAESRAPSP